MSIQDFVAKTNLFNISPDSYIMVENCGTFSDIEIIEYDAENKLLLIHAE